MTEHQHSVIGASSAERWFNCPGSILLSENIPRETSKYAAQGIAAHELCETSLKQNVVIDETWLGEIIEADEFNVKIDEEMIDAVNIYVGTIYEDMAQYGVPRDQLKVEHKICINSIDSEAYGTCDAGFVVPSNRVIVYDFKYGQGVVVDVQNNKQCLYYALGAYWALSFDERIDLGCIETVIVQPRGKSSSSLVRRATYTIDELMDFHQDLARAVERVRRRDNSLKSGPHCKFCPATAICPEIKAEVERQVMVDFGLDKPQLPEPQELSPAQISDILDKAALISQWVGAVQSYAHLLAENGMTIPGYKLAEGRSNRAWVNAEQAEAMFSLELGDECYERKFKSPAQMEKLLGKKRKEEVAPYVHKPPGKKVLVPVDDARPALSSDLESDFAGLLE